MQFRSAEVLPSPTRLSVAVATLLALGCAPPPPAPPPAPVATEPAPPVPAPHPSVPIARADEGAVRRFADPAAAHARGWMPLASTRVPAFLAEHPTYDGRGVIIGILDSGIDPGVEGLDSTSAGAPKLLDLRDFSGEGEVLLEAIIPAGDTLVHGRNPLLGGVALRELSPGGPWYLGRIAERRLGAVPAADLDGDGDAADTLALIVARDDDGWMVVADTDLDGSVDGEHPIRDYAVARQTLGWARHGSVPLLNLAVNLGERDEVPVLELVFDTHGHGTHVAGIAAAHRMYGVEGFDGVAPGAQLLGLKISNNAHGGVSTSGSILAAIRHALQYAAAQRMPLVLNLSFGVGNERDGGARIDALIDSVLRANPDLVFTISAGNDGPGISTVGFPGSASRAISVGATFPGAFLPPSARDAAPDRVAWFSGRGGELAKPDVVAPGVAYSTVPRWNAGQERSAGTSMASPHAAGLAALLVSGLVQEKRAVRAADVRAALIATARRDAAPVIAAGAGTPDVEAAWRWLGAGRHAADVTARAAGAQGSAVLHRMPPGAAPPAGHAFELLRPRGAPRMTYRLRSDAAWLRAPDSVVAGGGVSRLALDYDRAALAGPGVWSGAVTGWSADSAAGPVFRLVNTIVAPYRAGETVDFATGPLEPATVSRIFFHADTGRGFRVSVAAASPASAFLHEPGGRPYRDANARSAGSEEQPTVFEVDGADAEAGAYELVVAASPVRATSAAVSVLHAPVRLHASRAGGAVRATIAAIGPDSVTGDAMLLLIGGERAVEVRGDDGRERTVALQIPGWARSAAIDVRHPAGQWERFTDFGVTLFADDGSVIEQAPLNYSFGRLAFEVDDGARGRRAVLSLLPGLADAEPGEPWRVDVSIRFYAAEPVALSPAGADGAGSSAAARLALAPGAAIQVEYPITDGPWPLGEGFHSLAVLVAETGGVTWSREVGLGGPALPDTR